MTQSTPPNPLSDTRVRTTPTWPALTMLMCTLIALSVIVVETVSAKVMQPQGSRVRMDVPENFEPSKLFSGFIYPNASTSIVIAELPVKNFDKLAASFTDEALAQKGVRVLHRAKLERKDKHLYVEGEQTHGKRVFEKFILLISGQDSVAVITANVPRNAINEGFVKRKEIKAALASASMSATAKPIIKQFTMSDLGAFKEAGKLIGSAFLYTTDGRLTPKVKGTPRSMLIVAPSIDRFKVTDLANFSRRAFLNVSGFKDVDILEETEVNVGGLDGVKLRGRAKNDKDGTAVVIRQVMLRRPKGGYFRLIAILLAHEASQLGPDADRAFASFKPAP